MHSRELRGNSLNGCRCERKVGPMLACREHHLEMQLTVCAPVTPSVGVQVAGCSARANAIHLNSNALDRDALPSLRSPGPTPALDSVRRERKRRSLPGNKGTISGAKQSHRTASHRFRRFLHSSCSGADESVLWLPGYSIPRIKSLLRTHACPTAPLFLISDSIYFVRRKFNLDFFR